MKLERLQGAQGEDRWEELARLRIQVFHEFPYLYEGTLEYERGYLEPYWRSPHSLVVLARDGVRTVGATTALPLRDEHADLQVPGAETIFYLGESVLLPEYRGRGLGHTFFEEREAHARSLGYTRTAFFAVVRPVDHPLRPPDYRPLDAFWRARGYEPEPGLQRSFTWQDRDEAEPTAKPMQFWSRAL